MQKNRFWVRWYQGTPDFRPLLYPPGDSILGWWKSGESDGKSVLCACVEGEGESLQDSADSATEAILEDWPEAFDQEASFFDLVDSDWEPPADRFPRERWMEDRFKR